MWTWKQTNIILNGSSIAQFARTQTMEVFVWIHMFRLFNAQKYLIYIYITDFSYCNALTLLLLELLLNSKQLDWSLRYTWV